jgi:hypothetical protein
LGVNVEGKNPREIQKAIDEGEYDSKFHWGLNNFLL